MIAAAGSDGHPRHRKIAVAAVADASFIGASNSSVSIASWVESIRQTGQIGFGAIDPDGVGIDVKKRPFAKLRQRSSDLAARPGAAIRARRRSQSAAAPAEPGGRMSCSAK